MQSVRIRWVVFFFFDYLFYSLGFLDATTLFAIFLIFLYSQKKTMFCMLTCFTQGLLSIYAYRELLVLLCNIHIIQSVLPPLCGKLSTNRCHNKSFCFLIETQIKQMTFKTNYCFIYQHIFSIVLFENAFQLSWWNLMRFFFSSIHSQFLYLSLKSLTITLPTMKSHNSTVCNQSRWIVWKMR